MRIVKYLGKLINNFFGLWCVKCVDVYQVRVSNLMGKSLGSLTVTAETARHVADDAVVLSMKPFTVTASDP